MRTLLRRREPCFAVTRKGQESETPIDNLHIEGGKWQYTRRFHEDLAAKFWGIDLERWYGMSEDYRAEHVAVYELENEMRAYEEQESERKSKIKKGPKR